MSKMLVRSFLWLLVIVFGLTLSGVALAANFTANGNITIPSISGSGIVADMLIINGSAAASWQYNSGVLTVTNPDATAGFKVGSSDSSVVCLIVRDDQNSPMTTATNTTPGTSYVSFPTTAGIYHVIPSTSVCSATTLSANTSSSSGGGGGGYTPPVVTPPVVVPPPPVAPVVTPALSPALPSGLAKFTMALAAGANNPQVRGLQQFLNRLGFKIALSGPGSPGKETNYFGPATKAALAKFQSAKGIIKSAGEVGAGRFGPTTMAVVNATLAGSGLNQAAAVSAGINPGQLQKLLQLLIWGRSH